MWIEIIILHQTVIEYIAAIIVGVPFRLSGALCDKFQSENQKGTGVIVIIWASPSI